MSQIVQPSSGRLYLSKEPMVYVELDSKLEQHQIDGIRFLYRQFKKKNPGVILNDPLGYSHTKQVVLFINAVRQLLERAVLILCHHTNLSDWTDCFQQWTQSYDDLAIDESNPFLKKFIFITPMDKLQTFCRRDWGIIVVDHDDFLQYKDLPAKFKADYKIYITPHDLKENLDMFSAIFKWFHPKGQLNVDEFKPNTNNLKDVIAKSIIFQAFVEDIVLRRNIILAQPDTYKNPSRVNSVTRKNKDATGTKVKRTKRKTEDSTEVPNVGNKMRCETDLAGSRYYIASYNPSDVSISSDKNEVKDDPSDVNSAMDVESFILSQKPLQSDVFRDFVPDFDDNISQCSSKIEDVEEDFHDNKDVAKIYEINANLVSDSSMLKFNGNDKDMECTESSIQLHYSEDVSQVINTIKNDDDQLLPCSNKSEVEINNIPPEVKIENDFEDVLKTPEVKIENDFEDVLKTPEVKIENEFENEFKIKNNKVYLNSESDNLVIDMSNGTAELEMKTENSLNKDETLKSKSKKREIVDNKETGDNLNVTTAGKNFNDKLKELEEKTLKKFKGSLLDKIF